MEKADKKWYCVWLIQLFVRVKLLKATFTQCTQSQCLETKETAHVTKQTPPKNKNLVNPLTHIIVSSGIHVENSHHLIFYLQTHLRSWNCADHRLSSKMSPAKRLSRAKVCQPAWTRVWFSGTISPSSARWSKYAQCLPSVLLPSSLRAMWVECCCICTRLPQPLDSKHITELGVVATVWNYDSLWTVSLSNVVSWVLLHIYAQNHDSL